MEMAELLTDALKEKNYEFFYAPQTNQLFPILPNEKIEELRKQFSFHTWGRTDDAHTAVRFVTSFMTPKENVEALIQNL